MLRRATSLCVTRIAALALAFLVSQSGFGQGQLGPYGDTTSTPLAGSGRDYINSLSEIVDPKTGSLSIRVGAPVPTERALNLPQYAYTYDSNGLFGVTPHWAYSSFTHSQYLSSVSLDPNLKVYKPNSVSFSTYNADTTVGTGFQVTCTYWTDYIYTDPTGGRHPLFGFTAISNTNAQLGCPAIGINATASGQIASDGPYTAIFLGSGTAAIVFDNHGNLLASTDGYSNPAEDTNGNNQNSTGRTYGSTPVPTTSSPSMGGPFATLTVPGLATPSGFTAPYTFSSSVGARGTTTPFPFNVTPLASQDSSCPTSFSGSIGGYSGSSTLTLPDGTAYHFTLDPATGLINQITYPTGMVVDYVWATQHQAEYVRFALPSSSPSAPCAYLYDWPAITSRVVTLNGTRILEQDFSYTPPVYSNGVADWTQKQTIVTTKDLAAGTPAYQTIYTYYANPLVSETTATFDTSGALLKTVLKKGSPEQPTAVCTTYPGGLTGGVFYQYSSSGALVTDEATYDFGTLDSTCLQPNSPAMREVATAYHTFNPTPFSGTTRVIKDRPDTVKIYGGGPPLSETDYFYDQTPVTAVSNVSAHDEVNYGPGSTAPRGNATTVTRKCSIPNGPVCQDSSTLTTFDETGQPISVTDPNGNRTTYSFMDNYSNDNGSPAAGINTNTYITGILYPTTGSVGHLEQFQYGFKDGKLRSSRDQNNQPTTFCYFTGGCQGSTFDPWFRTTGTINPDGGGQVTSYFTVAGTQTIETTTNASPNPSILSRTTLDKMGRTVETETASAPGGSVATFYVYNGFGQLQSVSNPTRCSQGSSCAETTSGATTFQYDPLGRITKKTYPDGNADKTSYSANSTLVGDAALNQWRYTYDVLGRLTQAVEQANAAAVTYQVCQPNCITHRYGTLTTYQYDGLSNLKNVVQAGNEGDTSRTRSFTYDSLSRLITATNPETGTVCYGTTGGNPATVANCTTPGYDLNGNLLAKTDAKGVTVSYIYDALNRMKTKTANDGGNTNFSFTYDQGTNGVGRLTQEYDPAYSGTQFTYDSMGRIIGTNVLYYRAQNPFWAVGMGVNYDLNGQVTKLTYPDQRIIKQSWDGAGHIASVWDATGGTTGTVYFSGSQAFNNPCASGTPATNCAAYSPDGQLLHSQYGNGTNLDFTANSRLELCHMVAGSSVLPTIQGVGNLFDRSMSYASAGNTMSPCASETGNNGNIASIIDNRQSSLTQTFKYDTINRLTYAARSDGGYNHNYNYDAFGNMLLHDNLHTSPNYQIDASTNRLLLNSTDYQYDANGRLTSLPGKAFLYTAEGNLRSINAYSVGSYVYNSFGERTLWGSANQTPTWREFVYLNSEALADVDNNGVWTDYVSVNGRKIAKLNTADTPLHLSGDNCSNCGGVASAVSITSGAGYTVKSGDTLRFRQYTVSNAQGGLIMDFTDGTRAGGGTANDTTGQQINCDAVKNVWRNRVVDLSPFAGRTIKDVLAINDVCSGGGHFDIYWNDITVVGSAGNVVSILDPFAGQVFTPLQSTAWPGTTANLRAVAEPNTFAPQQGAHYFVADHLGTAQMEIGSGGWPLWQGAFTPFGQEIVGGAATLIGAQPADGTSMRYKFTGKERDAESGLDYFGARFYGSSLGRFMSPDPLGGHLENPQSLNRYAYALNNPLTNTDPTGLDSYLQCNVADDKSNASTCQSQRVGGTDKNPQMAAVQGITGANGFIATRIGNNPDGSGGLVDLSTGTGSYTASVNGSGVQFSNDGGQSSSSGVYVNGTPNNTFQDAGFANGGALSGFQFTLTNSKMEANQAEAGTFTFSGTTEAAGAALDRAGFRNVPGVNVGMDEYRSRGSFLTGAEAGHFNVYQILLSPKGSVPQASGNMHFGEHNPFSPLGYAIHIPFEASK